MSEGGLIVKEDREPLEMSGEYSKDGNKVRFSSKAVVSAAIGSLLLLGFSLKYGESSTVPLNYILFVILGGVLGHHSNLGRLQDAFTTIAGLRKEKGLLAQRYDKLQRSLIKKPISSRTGQRKKGAK
jgi:hypothetical protein